MYLNKGYYALISCHVYLGILFLHRIAGLSTTDFFREKHRRQTKNLSVHLPQKFVELPRKFVQCGHNSPAAEEIFTP